MVLSASSVISLFVENYTMLKKAIPYVSTLLLLFGIVSCKKLIPPAPKADEVMDAPLEGLTDDQYRLFQDGADEFDEMYTAEKGLGPIYVATSCSGCHAGDNKGHPFTALTRFGQNDTTGNAYLAYGAPQIQHRAIPGYKGETVPNGATYSRFIAPITAGVGFIDLVSDADILSMSDQFDVNNDGISGTPNWVRIPEWVKPGTNSISNGGRFIGRFGRKAGAYNLHQQVVGAYNNDMGLTTSYLTTNPYNYQSGTNGVNNNDVEISDKSLNANIFYMQVLQTPVQRNSSNSEVQKGKELFIQIGCESCHKQTLRTGYSSIPQLSNKDFHPYTDLLLHDMGPELDDKYTEGWAQTYEWRTTPLWGVGLSAASQGGAMYLLHDGRAHSFIEAIDFHGGEGSSSRSKFKQLSDAEKISLIKFLESL